MKESKLQLKELLYPSLSYEANPAFKGDYMPTSPLSDLIVKVTFSDGDEHFAWLTISQESDDAAIPYKFEVQSFARFAFVADEDNKHDPLTLSLNVARMLFSACREILGTSTGRAPHGAVLINGAVIEPEDVEIGFSGDMPTIMRNVFHREFPDEEVRSPEAHDPTIERKEATR